MGVCGGVLSAHGRLTKPMQVLSRVSVWGKRVCEKVGGWRLYVSVSARGSVTQTDVLVLTQWKQPLST